MLALSISFAFSFAATMSNPKTVSGIGGFIVLFALLFALISSNKKKKDMDDTWSKPKNQKKKKETSTHSTKPIKEDKKQQQGAKKDSAEVKKEKKDQQHAAKKEQEAAKELKKVLEQAQEKKKRSSKEIIKQLQDLQRALDSPDAGVLVWPPKKRAKEQSPSQAPNPPQASQQQLTPKQKEAAKKALSKIKKSAQEISEAEKDAAKVLEKDKEKTKEKLRALSEEERDLVKNAARVLAEIHSLEHMAKTVASRDEQDLIVRRCNSLRRLLDEHEKKIKADKTLIPAYKKAMETETSMIKNYTWQDLQVIHLIDALDELTRLDPDQQHDMIQWLFYKIREFTKTNYLLEDDVNNFLDLFHKIKSIDPEKDNFVAEVLAITHRWESKVRMYDEKGMPIRAPR